MTSTSTPIHVRLGDQLAPLDEFAARTHRDRAAALRRLVEAGLEALALPAGMPPITISCNVVTGRIEVVTDGWGDDDDARWDFTWRGGALHSATEVEPWGEEEFSMDRATEAVRDLGYTITEWTEGSGSDMIATVTGRA